MNNPRFTISGRRAICFLVVSFCVMSSAGAQQSLTIDSLIVDRNLWPREVTINVVHEVPLVVNGKPSGSMKAPSGRIYPVKSIGAGGVEVDAFGSALIFPAADTDVLARAELTKIRLEALAASKASPAPVAKPAPTEPS